MLTAPLSPVLRVWLLGACLLFGPRLRAEQARLVDGDLVAICGDSITEQKLYSQYLELYLLACQPAANLQVSQFGWGGETAEGFLGRMRDDVLLFKPGVATLSYGMNDGGYRATDLNRLKTYRDSLAEAVEKLKQNGTRMIVVGTASAVDSTTFKPFLSSTKADVYNQTLADFGAAAKEVAQKAGVNFADVHQVMMDAMEKLKAKYGPGYPVSGKGDGIHPNENGHLIMAYAFLKALGCTGDIGTLTLDLQSGQGTATDGHRILSASGTSLQVESTRYPFCFTGDPAKPDATRGVIEVIPFNQDLNRFMLVVKNARTTRLKVTWGTQSKEFASADLAKGINLAAEFLDNPFSEPFAALSKVVLKQQRYETPMVKDLLHNIPDWKKSAPEEDAAFGSLQKDLIQTDAVLRRASAAAVQPVRHTIEITAIGER